MSYTPTVQVVDLTSVIDNILAYITATQTDAHSWAFGKAMPDYTLYPNVTGRTATKFPQLMVVRHQHRGEEGETANGDVLVITLELLLEGAVSGRNHEQLVKDARTYAYALESMLANMTKDDISTDLSAAYLETYASTFDEVGRGGLNASSWIQMFQTACEFKLITSRY